MPCIEYKPYRPTQASQNLIDIANSILGEYAAQGFELTLRQLYYQFVSRDLISNSEKSYSNLGNVISRAREAGLIDWDHITDRGRKVSRRPHWDDGEDFLKSVANQFCLDLWHDQEVRCEVWVEKDALSQIAEQAARPWDVPVLANKGYISASAAWEAAHDRFLNHECNHWVIIHLGDHDPSGIDMTRDLQERLRTFCCPYNEDQESTHVDVNRIALNMDQIEEYGPPPNPAKQTDSRFKDYEAQFGEESWELDALEPNVLVTLIQETIEDILSWEENDRGVFNMRRIDEANIRKQLKKVKL